MADRTPAQAPRPPRRPTPTEWRRLAEDNPVLAQLIWYQEDRKRRLGLRR
ncbi:hypothetical protein [uncultured Streptomyces sp.]|nr:hypothetical protein [uncultured Streptomyces sp.]